MPHDTPKSVPLPIADGPPTIDRAVWYGEGLRFTCTQCGNCCTGTPGYVWLTTEDMQRIAALLRLSLDEFTRRFVRRVGERYALTDSYNGDCTFLTRRDGKTGCMIYPVRPMQCRTWPFWDQNLKSPSAWQRAAEHCPGMCQPDGRHYDLTHIETCRQHPESPH